jgi:hypothetical protein
VAYLASFFASLLPGPPVSTWSVPTASDTLPLLTPSPAALLLRRAALRHHVTSCEESNSSACHDQSAYNQNFVYQRSLFSSEESTVPIPSSSHSKPSTRHNQQIFAHSHTGSESKQIPNKRFGIASVSIPDSEAARFEDEFHARPGKHGESRRVLRSNFPILKHTCFRVTFLCF